MTREPIPEDLRRFILTAIPSVPYLEAMLLLRMEPEREWPAREVAQRLYMGERPVGDLLSQLCAAGVLVVAGQESLLYRYSPASAELGQMIDRLAAVYATNIVDVTNLVHSTVDRKAQQFADAFNWRKDN